MVSASWLMMVISIFVDRSVVRKAAPAVLMATTLTYYRRRQHKWRCVDIRLKQLTNHVITSSRLLRRSLASRAHFSSRLQIPRSSQLMDSLGSFPLRRSLAA